MNTFNMADMAREVVGCVWELRGSFGRTTVAEVLHGSQNAKIAKFQLNESASYGVLQHVPIVQIKKLIDLLAQGEYLVVSTSTFPMVSLGIRAAEVLQQDFNFEVGEEFFANTTRVAEVSDEISNPVLYERLRVLRNGLADEFEVPPYVVFSNATLRDMCAKLPATDEEFLQVANVGVVKLEKYGEAFMAEIQFYLADNGMSDDRHAVVGG